MIKDLVRSSLTGIIIITFIFSSKKAIAQLEAKPFRIALQSNLGFAIAAPNGFLDKASSTANKAFGWLNQVITGSNKSIQIVVYLPFNLRLYGGIHSSNFPERNADALLWKNIFLQDFYNNFEYERHQIKNKVTGKTFGIAYSIKSNGKLTPYFFAELRKEKLKSETFLRGVAFNFVSIGGLLNGVFEGNSILLTKEAFGFGAGFGFEIPFWRFVILPEIKYVSTISKIIERRVEYIIYNSKPNVNFTKITGDLTIGEDQKINIQYLEFGVGLRFILF